MVGGQDVEGPEAILDGRVRLGARLGPAGIGTSYQGTQLQLDRPVVVQVLSAEEAQRDPALARRFEDHALAGGRLDHPNCATFLDFGRSERGDLYLVREPIDGTPLSRMRLGRAPEARTVDIAIQVARALREAHALGFGHGSLGADCVWIVDDGELRDHVKVMDFALVGVDAHHEAWQDLAALGRLIEGLLLPEPAPARPSWQKLKELARTCRDDPQTSSIRTANDAIEALSDLREKMSERNRRVFLQDSLQWSGDLPQPLSTGDLDRLAPPPGLAEPPSRSRTVLWLAVAVLLVVASGAVWLVLPS